MKQTHQLSRRDVVGFAAALGAVFVPAVRAEAPVAVKVFKDANCGCCNGWIEHLRAAGFAVEAINSADMQAVKGRAGVPAALASCHTAEVGGYVVEGHVPAQAIRRLLAEKPRAIGLSAPGMPMGSPGMEGGKPEIYDVVLFGADGSKLFGRYQGAAAV